MNWTHEQLLALNYHLHPDGNYYPTPPPPRVLDSQPQHDPLIPLVKTAQAQTKGKTRIDIHIQRVSTKLQDFDNFVGGTKCLTDQLRYAGLIHDDDPESISASYTQQKCKHLKDEKTIIEIIYHPEKPLKQRQADTTNTASQQSVD